MKFNGQLRMSPDLRRLFDEGKALENVQGLISNNVEYILYLEYGTRRMRPKAMIRPYLTEYRRAIDDEMRHAFGTLGETNLKRAAEMGVTGATLRVMRMIADRTRVDTGRAKGGWVATLPNGSTVKTDTPIGRAKMERLAQKKRRGRR